MAKKLNLGHVTLIKNWIVAHFVSVTHDQTFTDAEKAKGRTNLGIDAIIGALADLTTTVKTNIVAAINEVTGRIDDIVAGSVTGVKGSAETEYRTGNVNITKDNIGLGNVDNTADMDKPMSTATKTYVDDAISTSAATFRGSVDAADDTEAAAQTALSIIETKDKNDFAYVTVLDTPATGFTKVKRYSFDGEAWSFQYALNNTGFSAEQLAALNSGITAAAVAQIATNSTAIQTAAAEISTLNTEVDAIEEKFDSNVSMSNQVQGKTYIDAGDEEATDAEVTAALNA